MGKCVEGTGKLVFMNRAATVREWGTSVLDALQSCCLMGAVRKTNRSSCEGALVRSVSLEVVGDGEVTLMHKTVLTTGDVAKICNVAPRTVSKWFDAGHLRGYRIPGSKDRRIPIEHLLRFMRAYGIPLNGLEVGKKRVLVFDPDAALCEAIRSVLTEESSCEVATATSALEAGAAAQELKPTVVIADVTQSNLPASAIVRFLRSQESAQVDCLIGTGNDLTESQGQALLQEGFDGFLSKPFDIKSLRNLIEQATSRATPEPSDR